MRKISRLVKRKENGIYYCRAAVPSDLIKLIGKREIKVSLGTADYKLARTLVLIESARINEEFAKLRGVPTSPTSSINRTASIMHGIPLVELIERYKSSPERQNISPDSKSDYESVYNVIKELLGERTPIHSIERGQCRRFQQVVMQIPAHATKRFPGVPLLEAIELNKEAKVPIMSVHNINKYISRFSGLLEWACEEGLLNSNPARGLLVQDAVKLKDKRDPFSMEQIGKIFSSTQMQEYQAKDSPRYWIPTLAIWTGARLNELCQLHIDDIREHEGILCLSINEEDGKQIKTASAQRLIPIHPRLIELGFNRLVQERRSKGHKRLFPELKNGSRGKPSEPFSKWFSRYLKDLKIKTDKTCFHSFRHNFRDALREAGIERGIARALGGWADKDAGTEEVYGRGYSVQRLYDAISCILYHSFSS